MRDAIDRCKNDADLGFFQEKVDSLGYPPDLETLVKGVEMRGGTRVRFLRSIPVDPMTKTKDWGLALTKTTRTRTRGAGKAYLKSTQSRRERHSTARNTAIGKPSPDCRLCCTVVQGAPSIPPGAIVAPPLQRNQPLTLAGTNLL